MGSEGSLFFGSVKLAVVNMTADAQRMLADARSAHGSERCKNRMTSSKWRLWKH